MGGDGGGGDGGDGGDGGSTSQEELTEVGMTIPGDGFQGVMLNHTRESGILEEEFEERGYTLNIQESWEGAALFAAGGPDFETLSTLEGARLGAERELEVASFGWAAPMFMGWWVEKGGPYDPEEVGGAQAVIDKVVEEGAQVGVGSWAGGDIPAYTIALEERFGYEFSEEGGDFNVVTADYFAIPQLIMQGDLAIGGTSPIHGVSLFVEDGEPQHREVFQGARVLEEEGLGVPPLNNLTTHQEIIDDDPGAAEALIQTWHRGMEWLIEDPMGRLQEDPQNFELVGVENEEQAQFLVDWGVNLSLDNEYPYNFEDQEYTDERIEADRAFLSEAESRGFVPSGWEDWLTFNQIPQE